MDDAYVVAELPYLFDESFVRGMALQQGLNTSIYSTVGEALVPERIGQQEARLIFRAVRAMHRGHTSPASTGAVLQWLMGACDAGRLKLEAVDAVRAYLDAAYADVHAPAAEEVLALLVPIAREQASRDALARATDALAKQEGLAQAAEAFVRAAAIGETVRDESFVFNATNLCAVLDEVEGGDVMLPTGVDAVDTALEGGLYPSQLGVFVADSGGGKSIALNTVAARSCSDGRFVAYASLELGRRMMARRFIAALVDLPTRGLRHDARVKLEAQARLRAIEHEMGACVMAHFPPGLTLPALREWVEREEERFKREVDVIIVDYADRMHGSSKDTDKYTAMGEVYEGLRNMAKERDGYAWTASQATRGHGTRKVIGLNSLADSQEKVRLADVVVSLNVRDDPPNERILYHFIKVRDGQRPPDTAEVTVGWDRGRICETPIRYWHGAAVAPTLAGQGSLL